MKTNRAHLIGLAVLGATLIVLCPAPLAAQTARERYETAQAREEQLRELLEQPAPDAPGSASARAAVLREARIVIASYETLVRRYHGSGYSDNALWNAGEIAAALYARFGRAEDKTLALHFYQRLIAEYPTSSLVKGARPAITALGQARVAPAVAAVAPPSAAVAPASAPPVAPPVAPAATRPPPSAAITKATLLGIERTVLPGTVRVVLALDREVAYREERLSGPSRVFFDLKDVQPAADLRDAVLRYPTDLVRQIRIGRHPDSTVRVVLDLDGVTKYSAYPLYNPFRLVIDCEPLAAAAPAAPTPLVTPMGPPQDVAVAPVDSRPLAPFDSLPLAQGRQGKPVDSPPVPQSRPVTPALGAAATPRASSGAGASYGEASPKPPIAAAPVLSSAPVVASPTVLPSAPNSAGGFSLSRQLGLGVARVVIDPGHGGHDPGAQVKGLNEADLTLDVALRLEELLQKEGLEVVLTRRTNVYIPLEERTAMANRENADLFLSIHANASKNTAARGVESYFLSFASSPEAEAVAARENSASAGGMHNLPDIIKAIALNNKLDESRDFAAMVQEALVTRLRRSNKNLRNLGVKKAPFVVLIGASMPSVLAEVSFLTNRQEAQLLKSPVYKQRIAEALHASVMRYRRSLKGQGQVAGPGR